MKDLKGNEWILWLAAATVVVFGLFILFGCEPKVNADTIFLNNGRSFYGKVYDGKDSRGRAIDNRIYRVEFGENGSKGYMDFLKTDVKKVEKNDKDAFKDHNFDLEKK